MSNSPLSIRRLISPNKNGPRNHKIDTITIHCTAGRMSVDQLCNFFSSSAVGASCNYAIGDDGKIATIVDESDRSWCSSNSSNDNRAITIECSSDATHPYAINSKVMDSLVKLCADICIRNGIPELRWKADKTLIGLVDRQNITVHRWFAAKACPGDYIYSRLGQIAADANKIIKGGEDLTKEEARQLFDEWYRNKNPTYDKLEDVPSYWRDDIKALMDKGIVKGTGSGLGLTKSEAKAAVIVYRGLKKAGL